MAQKRNKCSAQELASARRYREKHKAALREKALLRNATPERKKHLRNGSLVRLYGVTAAQFDEMLLNQCNLCALCKEPFGTTRKYRPTLDHDHVTGVVRGLLHTNCNAVLSFFGDDHNRCYLAATYLAIHNSRRNDPLSVPAPYRGLPPKPCKKTP